MRRNLNEDRLKEVEECGYSFQKLLSSLKLLNSPDLKCVIDESTKLYAEKCCTITSSIPEEIWKIIFDQLYRTSCYSIKLYEKVLHLNDANYIALKAQPQMQRLSCVCCTWSNIVHDQVVVSFKDAYKETNWLLCHFTQITSLSLLPSRHFIDDRSVERLINLKKLYLPAYKLVSDAALMKLTNLTHLDLRENTQILERGLCRSTQLTSLNLTRNEVIRNKAIVQLPHLTYLNLSGNYRITDDALRILTNITSLSLVDNEIISISGLQYLPKLTKLDLRNNKKITGLKKLTKLKKLCLSNSAITDKVLECMTNLRHLDLSVNYDYQLITDASVQKLTRLTSLVLSRTKYFSDACFLNLTNLTKLFLEGIVGRKISFEGIKHLSNLEVLNISKNTMIGDQDLGTCFVNLKTLLADHNNLICDDSIKSHPTH